jgi:pimeloyl-ACP methyl ester carboxylesterase
VNWHSCTVQGVDADCATIYVPTSYEQPSLGTTAIAVSRLHTSSAPIGDLFINPGGPGSAGISFAGYLAHVAPSLASAYDIVGFDPRGTGQSDPLVCLDTADLDALNAFDPTPETAAERQQGIDLVDAQGQACEKNSGLLADHVTTIEAARDIDVLRSVMGDDKLDYFGFSYGTFLGTTYAALFPGNVGRFVLDGAVAPGLNSMEASEVQTQGLQTEITAYIKDCTKRPACPLGSSASDAAAKLRDLLVSVDTNPLPTGDAQRPLTEALAFSGIVDTMYNPSSWPSLSGALAAALAGNGHGLLALADDYFDRSNGSYQTNLTQANQAINCLDEQVAGGPTQIPESKFVADSPIFGDIMFGSADRGCGDWAPKTTLSPPDYSAPGAPPILVIGTTRDPATPLVWAQDLAHTLDSGVLMTRNGDGHTAYLSGNSCIVQHVDDFLVGGVVPPNDTSC